MVKKLSYKKFYQWLDTCPVSWNETNHPILYLKKFYSREKIHIDSQMLNTNILNLILL